jgi:hypothetical protein
MSTSSAPSKPRAAGTQPGVDSLCAGPLIGGTVFNVPDREGFSLSASTSPRTRSARGRYNVLQRHYPAGSPVVDAALLELKAQRARDYVRDLVGSPPYLTPGQVLELVGILAAPEGGDHDAAA